MELILATVFFILSVLVIIILKVYRETPVSELRMMARDKEIQASRLYKVVIYRDGLDVFLWTLIGLSVSGFVTSLISKLPLFVVFIKVFVYVLIFLLWLPSTKTTKFSKLIAEYLALPLSWLMKRIHKPFDFLSNKLNNGQIKTQISLLNKTLTKEQIEIIQSTLNFNDKKVSEVMTPKRMIKMVSSNDTVAPVLLGELHDSGFSRFPVYRDTKDNIIGTLNIKDLIANHDGQSVLGAMSTKVYFVNEDKTLDHVLNAFYKTDHHIFIVVNNFEEVVGVITIEDVLEQILGEPIKDEFDKWENLREVAKLTAQQEHTAHKKEEKVVE